MEKIFIVFAFKTVIHKFKLMNYILFIKKINDIY